MKFREFITAFTFIILLALLLCIVYARATWDEQPVTAPAVSAEETAEPEQTEAPEPSKEPIYFTEDDVAEVAKMLWGEARGCTRDNQIKCAWIVCNRVDDESFPDTIQGVLSQPSQFHGYDPTFPVTGELYNVAFDVLTRWSYEKQGIPVRRELPNTYLWFTGDGEQNHFREEW